MVSERALQLEKKSHEKLQKQVLRQLKQAMVCFEDRLAELEYYEQQDYEAKEAQMLKQELQELDKNDIEEKLDSLKEQICRIGEREHKYFELDQQLRIVADKLYELDLTFRKFDATFDELRVVDIEVSRLNELKQMEMSVARNIELYSTTCRDLFLNHLKSISREKI